MAGWAEVEAIAAALPEVTEGTAYGNRAWKVRGKLFVWERPLRAKERGQLGGAAPPENAPILGVMVPGEEAKAAMPASEPGIYFTTPHFDGHASVLIQLDRIPRRDLEEAIVEAWLTRTPKRLAAAYLGGHTPVRRRP